jgi:hypothetical protein
MRVFVSYRRDDAAAWAGRLRDALAERFGARNIFQDVVAIRPGEDFTVAVDGALATSDAALVVIGPRWLELATSAGRPRLHEDGDHVRYEIGAALARDIHVVPVLVGGATLPSAAELPEELRSLPQRQAVIIDDATWHHDVDGLVRALRGEPVESRRPRRWLAAVGVVTLLVLGSGSALVLADRGDDEDGGAAADDVVDQCVTPSPPEWVALDPPEGASVETASGWRFEVVDGHVGGRDGSWRVVLRVAATNGTGDVAYHDRYYYAALAVDGIEFDATCFGLIAGQDPLDPDRRSDALVGFDVTVDPSGPLSLDLNPGEDHGRIDLGRVATAP